ncbi:hypothetical protein E3Q18_03398 [Wallemia mellicola]|uniref:ADF-H domain-containing protein n=1 Tax=Wallemia mellicola TaxID=1708541 RepID=A0A4T0QTH9_9BASI|nr:hypothetical protein E3Q23_03232 [Wallemia mellicola]TIB88632.1 hypothetical protein E3Q19_03287 [Wallemia mellicola]TIB96024.1 hypothetical protein E3Q18_03398 [Wallemia mellicola]TIC09504.1 hypothetical protein E3Q14_03337 [Wallemia mellicola]TIC09761.1 hypothetical protein E3Q15_03366 [Wallemia mellicola]
MTSDDGSTSPPVRTTINVDIENNIPVEVRDDLRKFRFSRLKGISVLIVKLIYYYKDKQTDCRCISAAINSSYTSQLSLETQERLEDISLEELADELPENAPRYVVISYPVKHPDGRIAVPLALINWKPTTSSPEMNTLHASGLSMFQQVAEVSRYTQIVEVRDGAEALTEELLNKALG